ncbi:MAG TPA: immunoglobulin domain-containing protein [Opitutus sp.]|nr:immunoglobulin domain-containing protein [Opitutus sp.]
MKLSFLSKRRGRAANLPTLSLIALLQRTPVVQFAATAEEFVLASPIADILKPLAAIAASLGAMNSLAGATPLVPSSGTASGITVAAGAAVNVAYTVTGTQTPPESWTITGTFPPGLNFSGLTSGGTVNVTNLQLAGTPTTGGSYSVNINAWEFSNGTGINSPTYHYLITVTGSAASAPSFTSQPQSQAMAAGGNVTVTAAVSGSPTPTLKWQRNGLDVAGAASASLALNNVQPPNTGLYTLVATNASGTVTSSDAIVGVLTSAAEIGDGNVVATSIAHPNGKLYDQVVLTGPAAAIHTQGGRTTRTSFIDENNDIVQVEFAGAGTLSLVLDDPSGPANPVNYAQNFAYMKGHVGLVIAGADETSNVLIFTVGRATAFDPTGHYDILKAPDATTNNPATNGSPLFAGHDATHYDGFADLAFVAITSTNGKFGGLRASNAHFSAVNGITGVYAPGVAFAGPVYIGDIDAGSVSATVYATPAIIIGSTADARITGGDLRQTNGKAVQVHGLTQLKFTAGSDAAGTLFPAQNNQGVLEDNGVNVTSQVVVNP